MITISAFRWVPPVARGQVRDLRVRWALEEAKLPYRVESTPFRERGAEHQGEFGCGMEGSAELHVDSGAPVIASTGLPSSAYDRRPAA